MKNKETDYKEELYNMMRNAYLISDEAEEKGERLRAEMFADLGNYIGELYYDWRDKDGNKSY